MYKSFVSLGRYIPKYFILFVAMVNGIVSLNSISAFSWLVYKNARGIRWQERWEGGSGWGTCVNPWLFHFNV